MLPIGSLRDTLAGMPMKSPLLRHKLPKVPAEPPPPAPLDVHTQTILQLIAANNGHAVDTRAEVGRILAEVKAETPHGEWLFYVQDRLPLSSSTAKRAIQLYAFSQSQPALFATLRPLGLTKIYALIKLPPDALDAFLGKLHEVRSGVVKSPLQMTFAEMMAVLHGPPKVETAPVKLVKAVKRFAKGLVKSVESMLDLPGFNASDELHESLETISDEAKRVVELIPKTLIGRRTA
jgi:Protein of unknown function (DUF3102)